MLSDLEIRECIESGAIGITPFEENNLESGNYKLRLGSKILIPKSGQRINIKNPVENPVYTEFDLEEKDYVLKPKEFILAQTLEKISLDKDIAGLLDGKSTLARLGLSVHQSSQFIAPGQKPHIVTLEIFNAGEFEIELSYAIQIAKIIFFKFTAENSRAYDDYGKYSKQTETTGALL